MFEEIMVEDFLELKQDMNRVEKLITKQSKWNWRIVRIKKIILEATGRKKCITYKWTTIKFLMADSYQ